MKVSSRWMITGVACLVVLLGLAVFKYTQVQAMIAMGESFPEPSESVEAVQATLSSETKTVNTIGHWVAPQSIELRNEEEGRVTRVNIVSGNTVKKGDLLVQVDISEEQARLQAAEARVELSRLDLKRVSRLISQKTVSQESVDQAEASYAVAKADVLAIKATIAKKSLYAPFDAVVGLHTLEVGEYLQANTFIATLLGLTDYSWVDFSLPLERAALSTGDQIKVGLSDIDNTSFTAQIIAKEVVASTNSRNVKYRAQVASPLPQAPNTIVRIMIPTGTKESVIIPRISLVFDHEDTFVYVLNAESNGRYRAERRSVIVGDKQQNHVSILSGLNAGELVAAQGTFKLLPGLLTFVRERPTNSSDDSVAEPTP